MSVLFLILLAAETVTFSASKISEVVAHLELSSLAGDTTLAGLTLDSNSGQQVALWAGEHRNTYSVFLGSLRAGAHSLRIENARVHSVRFQETDEAVIVNAPVLHARGDTVGKFNDVPMLAYCERLPGNVLEYTVIFSNEDGGTSTRALMARWGRTTDVEFIYRVWLDGSGRTMIQAKDHKEIAFTGAREESHPLLYVSTRNNMVAADGVAAARFQLAPQLVDLNGHSREQVMDDQPLTYRAASLELQREDKLRPFGVVDGQNISDPRNYLYLEANVRTQEAAIAVLVRLRGEDVWRSSNLGNSSYAIDRNGWARSTVELPPQTNPESVEEVGFQCLTANKQPQPVSGVCRVEAVTKAFFLGSDYKPGASIWGLRQPVAIPSGEMRTFRVQRSAR